MWDLIAYKAGLVRRDPMSGRVVGFEWSATLSLASSSRLDLSLVGELLEAAEAGMIVGPAPIDAGTPEG